MKKIILAPDSFKGTLTSTQICGIMEEEILACFPHCQVISLPVADGGEGTCDCFLQALPGEMRRVTVTGPFFEQIDSFYCVVRSGGNGDGVTGETGGGDRIAVVEMAAAAGLPMVEGRKNPLLTTTYGVGELVRHAVKSGVSDILVGIGGSATNDGGAGMAAALGVVFRDRAGHTFIPTGGTLEDIAEIDTAPAKKLLRGVRLRTMCDVDNPLYGPEGAAYIFGPQKGADEAMIRKLDDGLRHLGALLARIPGKEDVCQLPGAGAAGGMGGGMYAMLNFVLTPGIEAVLDVVRFDSLLPGCDLILTGEGRIDEQSLRGKVVAGVARRAREAGVPVCAIVGGALDDGLAGAHDMGISSILTINRQAIPFSQSKDLAPQFMRHTIRNLMQLLSACGGRH